MCGYVIKRIMRCFVKRRCKTTGLSVHVCVHVYVCVSEWVWVINVEVIKEKNYTKWMKLLLTLTDE